MLPEGQPDTYAIVYLTDGLRQAKVEDGLWQHVPYEVWAAFAFKLPKQRYTRLSTDIVWDAKRGCNVKLTCM